MTQRRWMLGLTCFVLATCLLVLPACEDRATLRIVETPTDTTGATQEDAPQPTNVILFVADGAGFNTFHATSYYQHGELGKQVYDAWPVRLGCTTGSLNEAGEVIEYNLEYAHDPMVILATATDSAAAATALYTGQKTLNGRIGMTLDGDPLVSFPAIAKNMGYRVGTVSSVELSHATPAATAAHNLSRNNYSEIANELFENGTLDVLIGCGHPNYDAAGKLVLLPEAEAYDFVGGKATWDALATPEAHHGWTRIDAKEDFEALASGEMTPPDRLLGVPRARTTLQYNREGVETGNVNPNVPDLKTLTIAGLKTLRRDGQPFVLVVEGGAVDWANHGVNLGRTIEEMSDFNHTIEAVMEYLDANDLTESTLVIVTSDHETGDLRGPFLEGDLRALDLVNNGAGELPGAGYGYGGHTNRLVPLFATGPGSEEFDALVTGTDERCGAYVDNTSIFTVVTSAIGATVGAAP